MPIQSIDNRRLYRQIADQLAQLITQSEFKPGERLPAERDLALKLGVSRPSVREALIALEVEGWVDIRGGSGVYVRPAQQEHQAASGAALGPFDVMRARALVESEAAALAAEHADEAQREALSQAVAAMRTCSATDPRRFDLDAEFHMRLAEASGNGALPMLVALLWEHRRHELFMTLEQHFDSEAIWQVAIAEHAQILHAVLARDTEGARRLTVRHMHKAEERLSSSFDPP